jgi:ElaB/YqjD/DUF883 family membrane-anchored ribosome-binding protein
MANEQNKEAQDSSFKDTENQSSTGTTGSIGTTGTMGATGSTGTTGASAGFSSTGDDAFSGTGSQGGSSGLSTDSAKETAKGLYDQAKGTAGQAFGAATQKATEVLEEKKVGLAGGLTSVADSIRQVGDTLRESDEETGVTEKAAQYGDTLAQQIEKISHYFERNDVRTMVRDMEGYARRNPAVFIGAAFAVGMLAARFLKSSPSSFNQGGGQSFDRDLSINRGGLSQNESLIGGGDLQSTTDSL